MKFNWQVFFRVMAVFAILDACILMSGCGDWESTAVNIIGLLGPAIQSIIAILAALGVKVPAAVFSTFQNWAQQTQTALVTLKGLILSVKTAVTSAEPGILNAIGAALQAIATQLQAVLPELHIDDPASQAKVEEALAAVIGFVGEIAAIVPMVSSSMKLADAKVVNAKAKAATSKFRATFNAAVSFFGPQYEI